MKGRRDCFLPGFVLGAGRPQHPFLDRCDQSGSYGEREELLRGNQSAAGMLPAKKRLRAGNSAAGQRHNGLVMNQKLLTLHCLTKIGLRPHECPCGNPQAPVKKLMTRPAVGFSKIHRTVCVVQDVLRFVIPARAQRDSNARGSHYVGRLQIERQL